MHRRTGSVFLETPGGIPASFKPAENCHRAMEPHHHRCRSLCCEYGLFFKDLGSQFLGEKHCMHRPCLSVELLMNSFVQTRLGWFFSSTTLKEVWALHFSHSIIGEREKYTEVKT